jgi:hypothetical protein
MVELSGAFGSQQVHEVHVGGSATPGCSAATLGLSLAEAKAVLAGLQRRLVQAQAEEHCQVRRRCPRCGGQQPLQVCARLECAAIMTPTPLPPPTDAETIALSIDSGHVRR